MVCNQSVACLQNAVSFSLSSSLLSYQFVCILYTEYVGWAVTARIPVKFGTAHGRSRPEVGSTKRIGASGQKGVPPAPRIFGTSD